MNRNNLYGVGGAFAIIAAIGLILVGISFLLMPGSQRPGGAENFE